MNNFVIKKLNMKMEIKNNGYIFSQQMKNISSFIKMTPISHGFISFSLEVLYDVVIKYDGNINHIKKNTYVNINVSDTLIIKSVNKKYINTIKISNFQFITEKYYLFDFNTYRNNYEDLKNIKNNKILWYHWCQFGKKEGRTTDKVKNKDNVVIIKNDVPITNNNYFKKYLSSNNSNNKIEYCVMDCNNEKNYVNNKLWAHLHCSNINNFFEIYDKYITYIEAYFSIIVTFCEGKYISNKNITTIKLSEKCSEASAKIACIHYLNDKNIDYNNLLMLNDINDTNDRQNSFFPFVYSLKQINYISSIIYHYDLIMPDLIHTSTNNDDKANNIYKDYNELMKFKDIKNININGNCLICSQKLINIIYPKDTLNVFYDVFNTNKNISEKLWLNVCENIDGKYKMIPHDSCIVKNIKLKYNFDANLYNLINSNSDNSIENIENIKCNVNNTDNIIYSLRQIMEKLPLNFDVYNYVNEHKLFDLDKYKIIDHYIKNNKSVSETKWIDVQTNFNFIKTFVYIFPQFHEIEENNNFWGDGFTEWWNVRKTYQVHNKQLPMHPHEDIGYYNILDYNTRKRWDNYAEEYGFYGYVYCHFYFSKGIIMNEPLDKILKDNQPNKPWFLNWINENWTKRWDGGNNEILLDIKINNTQCEKHFNVLLKYFKHHNYYKINNKPVLGIYRPTEIHSDYINKLIELSKRHGFDGIEFSETLNMQWNNTKKINNNNFCDIQFEYPVNYTGELSRWDKNINKKIIFYDKKTDEKVINYDLNKHYQALIETKYTKNTMRGIVPCWDNFPRHMLKSCNSTFINSNSFDFYLVLLKQFILIKKEKGEYSFINALNEWAEQCVMEPSIENEYSYLESFKLSKKTNIDLVNENLLDKLIYFSNVKKIVFVSHTNFNSGAPIVLKSIINYLDKTNNYDIYLVITNNFNNVNKELYNNVKLIYCNFNNLSVTECKINTIVATKILEIINPDFVFISTFANYEFIKASNDLNIHNIIYIHEKKTELFRIKNNNHEFSNFPEADELKKINKIFLGYNTNDVHDIFNINGEYLNIGIDFNEINTKINGDYKIYNKTTFGMCGYGTYRKGFDIFLNIAKKYKQFDFVWIGPIQDFKNSDLPKNFVVTGFTNNVVYYLKNLAAILFTSREDPFPLVIMEFLYLDLKIISSHTYKNNIGSFELIEKFGIITNNEYDNLDVIINKQLIVKSKKYIIDNFNINKCCDHILKYIQNIPHVNKKNFINVDDALQSKFHKTSSNTFNVIKYNDIFSEEFSKKYYYNDSIYKLNYEDIEMAYKNIDASEHYNNNNNTEKRISYPLNSTKTIAIMLQIHNLNNFDIIEKYVLKNIKLCEEKKYYCEIFIACSNKDLNFDDFKKNIKKTKINIIYCENIGMDLYKFFKTIKYIYEENYGFNFDYFIKIHSKTDRDWLIKMLLFLDINIFDIFKTNNEIGFMNSNQYTRLLLKDGKFMNNKIESSNFNNLKYLSDLIGINMEDIYNKCDSENDIINKYKAENFDKNMYKKYNADLIDLNEQELKTHFDNRSCRELRCINNNLFNKINHPKYCSGTIFMCRGSIFYDKIDVNFITTIENKIKENKEFNYFNDYDESTLTHTLERFIGLLNYTSGYNYLSI